MFANVVAAQAATGLRSQGDLANFENAVDTMRSIQLRT